MKKRVHIYYSGSVQGVGFRYSVQRIAEGLNLRGWVRNLDDGSVEISAEGDEGVLNNFIAQIDSNFKLFIKDKQTNWEPATGEFRDFSIRF